MIAPPSPPSHDELEALIKEARERQLRRRLLGAAAVAIAAAVGLGLYALTTGARPGGTTSGSPGIGVPVCRSGQLSTSAEFTASGGSTLLPVAMSNTSSLACALPRARPDVQLLFRAKPFPIEQEPWSAPHAYGSPAGRVIVPGKTTVVELAWRDWCPHPAAEATTGDVNVVLRFPGGLQVTALETGPDVPGPVLPACGEVVDPPQQVAVSQLLRQP